jgi:hypothetical protein
MRITSKESLLSSTFRRQSTPSKAYDDDNNDDNSDDNDDDSNDSDDHNGSDNDDHDDDDNDNDNDDDVDKSSTTRNIKPEGLEEIVHPI